MMVKCFYCCNGNIGEELYLTCSSCNKEVHIECLKLRCVPGGLLGDNFFNYICESCSEENCEQITRQKLSWFTLIILVLYNLHKRSAGVSRRGYFHWKNHICNFIDKHWNILFGPAVRRKKTWMGTVSGTLSHFCPSFFVSGTEELKEPGWWRIAHVNMTPPQIVDLYGQHHASKKKTGKCHGKVEEIVIHQNSSPLSSGFDESSMSTFEDTSSMDFSSVESEQRMGMTSSGGCASTSESICVKQGRKLSNCENENADTKCMFSDLFMNEEHLPDMDVDVDDVDPLDFRGTGSDGFQDLEHFLPSVQSYGPELSRRCFPSILPDITHQPQDHLPLFSLEDPSCGDPPSNSSDTISKDEKMFEKSVELGSEETSCEVANETQEAEHVLKPSLFVHTQTDQRIPPWEELEEKDRSRLVRAAQTKCVPMSKYEEQQLLSQLRQASKTQELPGFARRLYRKLCVRHQKRQRGLPIFNIDKSLQNREDIKCPANVWMKPDHNSRNQHAVDAPILDRFYHVPTKSEHKGRRQNCPFKIRIMGCSEPTCFLSPYTQRQLKPYIRRDYETTPRWLKLLSEIQVKANENNSNWQPPQRCPIDYCYVRPQHISTVNSLCCEFFYPGIDLSETLQYPDFSCVVLYRKLVVAFAFMVPDAGYNETYITFLFTRPEWRGAGIATFMLYHLIQTCMGKDITLHVSATNPAVLLYQKFGFKIEEFVLDFYDKYLPSDSQECKHALFLRLSR